MFVRPRSSRRMQKSRLRGEIQFAAVLKETFDARCEVRARKDVQDEAGSFELEVTFVQLEKEK